MQTPTLRLVPAVEHKRCYKCQEEKPASDFWASRTTADGLYWYCKVCELARAASRRRAAGQEKRTPKPPQPSAKEKEVVSKTERTTEVKEIG